MTRKEELILRMQPYPKELKSLCMRDLEFAKALKSIHSGRFVTLGAVSTSYPPNSDDEIIGFYVYDFSRGTPKLKQDFIVNVCNRNRDFVIYTRYSGAQKSRIIRDISHFYSEYPSYGPSTHYPHEKDLTGKLKERAKRARVLAMRIKHLKEAPDISLSEYIKYDIELLKLGL